MPEEKDHETELIAFVIFGVTGDLTKRKLMPALYQLSKEGRLPAKIKIIGFARRPWTDKIMRDSLTRGVHEFSSVKTVSDVTLSQLLSDAKYIQSTFEDERGYKELREVFENENINKILYYLATPPVAYSAIIQKINVCELETTKKGWQRIVVEKPYGRDKQSAQNLEKELHACFREDQIYRIDHYLGKETVQNILVFRFANGIFEPLWNNHYIDHIQITVAETIGVGTRAGFFDKVGIIRDMFANHLLQLLTLTAMESPFAFNANAVRDEKMKVLKSLRPMKGKKGIENAFRAQYESGLIEGEKVPGYKDEQRVPSDSITETYLAVKLFIDNWRWVGVPFYIRCGKRLPVRATEISIHFKQVPLSLFHWRNMAGDAPNILTLRVQPDEGIHLSFGAKVPGPINQIAPVKMGFRYKDTFGGEPPQAYERLLLDCMVGDATLFTRSDEAIAQWQFTTDILDAWAKYGSKQLTKYAAGTWGPKGAQDFIQRDKRKWINPK